MSSLGCASQELFFENCRETDQKRSANPSEADKTAGPIASNQSQRAIHIIRDKKRGPGSPQESGRRSWHPIGKRKVRQQDQQDAIRNGVNDDAKRSSPHGKANSQRSHQDQESESDDHAGRNDRVQDEAESRRRVLASKRILQECVSGYEVAKQIENIRNRSNGGLSCNQRLKKVPQKGPYEPDQLGQTQGQPGPSRRIRHLWKCE